MEVSSSTRKNYLFTFYNHPSLVRFLSCKMSMRYICPPYLISAFGPLDWNLLSRTELKAVRTENFPIYLTLSYI